MLELLFELQGKVGYSVGSCRDERQIVTCKTFNAGSQGEAVRIGRSWLNEQRTTFGQLSEFCVEVNLLVQTVVFWKATITTDDFSLLQDSVGQSHTEEILEIVI